VKTTACAFLEGIAPESGQLHNSPRGPLQKPPTEQLFQRTNLPPHWNHLRISAFLAHEPTPGRRSPTARPLTEHSAASSSMACMATDHERDDKVLDEALRPVSKIELASRERSPELSPTRSPVRAVSRGRVRAIYGFMLITHFMLAVDMTSVAVALPLWRPSLTSHVVRMTLTRGIIWVLLLGDCKRHERQQYSRFQHGHRFIS